jgi:hypothetical protein
MCRDQNAVADRVRSPSQRLWRTDWCGALLRKRSPEWNLTRRPFACGAAPRIARPVAPVSRYGTAIARDGRLQRQEAVIKSIIDLGSGMLFDRSRVASPYVRLLVTAIGQELARGSPWVSVNKRVLAIYEIVPELLAAERLLPH